MSPFVLSRSRGPADWSRVVLKFYLGGTVSVANHGGWLPPNAGTVLLLPGPKGPTIESFSAYLRAVPGVLGVRAADVVVGQVFSSGGGNWQPIEITAEILGSEPAAPGSAEESRLVNAVLAAFAQVFLSGRMEALSPIRSALRGAPSGNYRSDAAPRVVFLGESSSGRAVGGAALVLGVAVGLLYWARNRRSAP